MKRTILVLGILLVVGGLVFSAGSKEQAQQIQMKFGHYAADGHPGDRAAKMFAEGVEKRTNGAVKIAVYPNNQLGDPPQMLEQNILGAIDMSLPTQGALDKYSKKFATVMLPFVFRDYCITVLCLA
ncbi:MAG: TRAP transporter substrate-binding protein DctP [Spirochaetales bacterium]